MSSLLVRFKSQSITHSISRRTPVALMRSVSCTFALATESSRVACVVDENPPAGTTCLSPLRIIQMNFTPTF